MKNLVKILTVFLIWGTVLNVGCGAKTNSVETTDEKVAESKKTEKKEALIHIESAEQFYKVVEENSFVAIDFYADWCGPCRRLAPIFEKAAGNNEDIVFLKIDVDKKENRPLAVEYKVSSIPLLVFVRDGKLHDRSVGLIDENKLNTYLEDLKSRD